MGYGLMASDASSTVNGLRVQAIGLLEGLISLTDERLGRGDKIIKAETKNKERKELLEVNYRRILANREIDMAALRILKHEPGCHQAFTATQWQHIVEDLIEKGV